MGYTTDFEGSVEVSPPLNEAERSFLHDLADTRRMNRTHGPLFVKGEGFAGQGHSPDIIDYNSPDETQPGLWLGWGPSEDGTSIEWDGREKFYYSEEWMAYLINNLLAPSGRKYVEEHAATSGDERLSQFTFDHTVNGTISAQGEDPDDQYNIIVNNNAVVVEYTR